MNHTITHTTEPATSAIPSTSATTPAMPQSPMTTGGLQWLGPLAFTRRHSGGIDRDFGDQWGRLGDQRLTVRHQLDTDHGLLYVYDATWAEYAVLADDVSLLAVHEAAAAAAAIDPHAAVTRVARAAVTLSQAAPRQETAAPDGSAASPGSPAVAQL